jgi:hypothetical protein
MRVGGKMLEQITDVAMKLATVVAVSTPKYPLYIPFDLVSLDDDAKLEEWVLSYTYKPILNGFGEGLCIMNYKSSEIKFFDGLYDMIGFFTYTRKVDWEQLGERITIATTALAALNQKYRETIEETFGEGFCKESVKVREDIETAMLSDPNKLDKKVRMTYLSKMSKADEPKTEEVIKPSLSIVKEEE